MRGRERKWGRRESSEEMADQPRAERLSERRAAEEYLRRSSRDSIGPRRQPGDQWPLSNLLAFIPFTRFSQGPRRSGAPCRAPDVFVFAGQCRHREVLTTYIVQIKGPEKGPPSRDGGSCDYPYLGLYLLRSMSPYLHSGTPAHRVFSQWICWSSR